MLNSLTRFLFVSLFLVSVPNSAFAAEGVVTPSNTQLPQWFYQELIGIKKDVSDLDAKQVSEDEVQDLKDRLSKVETVLELSEKGIDKRLDEQDKFIDAIYSSIDRFGIIASWIAGGASLLLLIASFLTASNKAQAVTKEWLKNNKSELDKQLAEAKENLESTLKEEIKSAREQIKELINHTKVRLESVTDMANAVIEDIVGEDKDSTTQNKVDVKPENERTSRDFLLLAVNEYSNKKYENALNFVNKGLQKEHDFNDKSHANLLLFKGIALGQLNLLTSAIEVFDELIEEFKESSEVAIKELIAKALICKAVTLDKLDINSDDAIAVYEEIIEKFKQSDAVTIQIQVAKALLIKGFRLGLLNRLKQAINTYDELIKIFKDNKEPAIQERVITALISKAELTFVLEGPELVKAMINNIVNYVKEEHKLQIAIVEILRFMIDEETINNVLQRIESIPTEEIKWSFKELKPAIEKFESPKKEQVEAIARFFEEHKDKVTLREELGL